VLFIDEIHRFNKGQQDALLPGVEAGWVTLIGATTENPFFELNAPLLSRCQLVRLEPLGPDDVRDLLHRACDDPVAGFGGRVTVTEEALATSCTSATATPARR
jgi:putative ATPase